MKSAELAPLGNLTTHVSSGATPRGGDSTYLADGPVMFIRSQHVHMDGLRLDDISYIADDVDAKMKRSRVLPGDVLLNITGASIGRVAAFDLDKTRANVNQHVCIIRPKPEQLDYRYLVHFLRRDEFQRQINGMQNGGTRQALNFAQIKRFEIPLPPLPEQRRIAGILDAADAIRRKRQQAIALTEQFLRSTFLDMFGDPVTNEKGLKVKPMIELVDSNRPISYGILKPGPDIEDGVPYIRVVDIRDGGILTDQLRRTTPAISQEFRRSVVQTGDLLMSIRGHVGRMGFVPDGLDGANITQDTARLAISPPEMAAYVYWCLDTEFMKRWMARHTKGVAVQGINLGDVKQIPIPIPSDPLLHTFYDVQSLAKKSLRTTKVHHTEANHLFNSLVQRAFRGEL
ncbi:restriction endonuclease subunit S [Rosistilla oblonga]|uniref:restriction endonuclease subunit S n=1 Tax=Rosistilla oblonga TaxID=2527990 RepID=UPI003A979537